MYPNLISVMIDVQKLYILPYEPVHAVPPGIGALRVSLCFQARECTGFKPAASPIAIPSLQIRTASTVTLTT